jgi:DNA-binding transcriptional MocR family regulator
MVRITQEELWAKIPYWVLTDSNLDSYAVRVYCVLSKHANWTTRHSSPGVRRIAEEAHCSTNTVLKSLADLEAFGCIVVTREKHGNRHKVNQYHLPVLRVSPHETPNLGPDVSPGATRVSPHATPDVSPHETELDPQSKRTREDDFALETPKEPRLPGESRAAYARRMSS